MDLGFVPGKGGKNTDEMLKSMDVLFIHSADEFDITKAKGFKIYIGSHGDVGAHHADVILPASTYTEKSGTYVNTEGRVQMTSRAAFAPGDAKEDWAIIRALSSHLGVTLGFDSLSDLRSMLYSQFPHFARLDEVAEAGVVDVNAIAKSLGASKTGKSSCFTSHQSHQGLFHDQPNCTCFQGDGRMFCASLGRYQSRRQNRRGIRIWKQSLNISGR